MASRRISPWLIALMAVIAALLAASTNVATGVPPDAWQAHPWLAWPALMVSLIGLIVLGFSCFAALPRDGGDDLGRERWRPASLGGNHQP